MSAKAGKLLYVITSKLFAETVLIKAPQPTGQPELAGMILIFAASVRIGQG